MVANISVVLVTVIVSELEVMANNITYWMDATCVLHYIKKKLRPVIFFANRLEKMYEHSQPSQLCYMPTDKNPTDIRSCRFAANKCMTLRRGYLVARRSKRIYFGLTK